MSTRWFFSSVQVGASASARERSLKTSVTFAREIDGRKDEEPADGPTLSLLGPEDVLGFDRTMVLREEPPPGAAPAAENILASIELAHADLPWLLSPGSGQNPPRRIQPWFVLVVLDDDEAQPPREGDPLPVLTAPVAALPPLADRWAWAHVEARLDDGIAEFDAARRLVELGARQHSAQVIARLVCPRRLKPDRGWIAAVVPATEAGRKAGLAETPVGSATVDAWPSVGGGTVELPVYHWWRFRTGKEGTFEELARRLKFRHAAEAGLGTRTVDVSQPWSPEQGGGTVTVALDGALRVPGSAASEVWSDSAAQETFKAVARKRLDEPARRRDEIGDPEADPDTVAVAPPLYGSDHTGQQTVPANPESWMTTLNLEIRRRAAAALGARYVQLEQEFLMARAWEQVGEIREANRLLAVTELAAAVAEQAQHKHLDPLDASDLVAVMAPASKRMRLPAAVTGLNASATLAATLAGSPVLAGAATSSFARLTRRGGALSRRAARGANRADNARTVPVITQELLQMEVMNVDAPDAGLPGEMRALLKPFPLQWRRLADRIPIAAVASRTDTEARPLRPIMAHPTFAVPVATELLALWPEWAVPGIGALPLNCVTLLETNPEFCAALLVGLNHEFNRELLWREFPTDQRGTSFARFWPTAGADIDEIARWPLDAPLGSQLRAAGEGSLALPVRGELLRRFPGTELVAVPGQGGKLPETFNGVAATPLALDESTVLYLFDGIGRERAIAEDWFFVFREPMRGTQFGFDTGAQPPEMETWADLTWSGVRVDAARCIILAQEIAPPKCLPPADPPMWGRDAADMARIAYQQPFQLAFRAAAMLGA
ncbi:hypothetical protein GCM10010520_54980 [Rhizobium viscosum]|uniref:Uncharacterized protein n=1 Tax=Rhizobium viscosum TaxID=1673 RepID=A0ABR9J065_RHIVS|nr:hypothetical protein [Rhizobium viscosum]MBE1508703.1 hypothetical protein [Rhizobium viscosum]